MTCGIAFHRNLNRVLAALTAVFGFLHLPAAQAAMEPYPCPVWHNYHSKPEAAFDFMANKVIRWSVPAACLPVIGIGCAPAYTGPLHFDCVGAWSSGGACPTAKPTGQMEGSGFPITGNVIYHNGIGGKSYCVIFTDDTKNRGDDDPKGNCSSNCNKYAGNPVNVAAANKFQRESDFPGTAAGDLVFERYYNSLMPLSQEAIGTGWSHSWSRSLFIAVDRIRVTRADGKSFMFRLSGSQWAPDADVSYKLVQLGTGGWQLTTATDEVETYSPEGRLASILNRSGRVTALTYSDGTGTGSSGSVYDGTTIPIPVGFLIRATDDTGRTIEFRYNDKGNIVRILDPTGASYLYTYDTSGALAGVTYPNGRTRTYHYNESANTSGANLPHTLTGITDENGDRFATYKYLSNRRPLSTEHAGGVNKYEFTYGSSSTTYVDPLGTSRTANYAAILGVKQVTSTSRTCAGCGPTTTESYTFDANRNATSHKDFKGNLTCNTYNARNLQTARTEGLSGTGTCSARVPTAATRTITTEWHPTWRLTKRVAEPLKITTFTYHGESGVSCAPTGAATTLACSRTVQATTDADGSLGFAGAADGPARTWSYTYNSQGRVLAVDGPRSDVPDVTTYAYYAVDDPAGGYRVGDLASVTNAMLQATQYAQYDGAGRVARIIDPNGLETHLEYWPRGWLKSRKVGTTAAGFETTSYAYDDVGQLTTVTAPDGSFVLYRYDAAHRLTQVSDGLGNRIEYTLDNMGNRIAENAYDPGNALSRSHSRVIDGLNRLFKDIGGTNPATQIMQNGYDANGNVTSILDPLGRTTTQEYDALNRLSAVKDPFNGPSAPTAYSYNRQGSLTQVTDPTGLATTYTVNGHGETVVQSSPDTGTTSFTYDAASNVTSRLDARGVQATYAYDALNRVTLVTYPDETVTYTYDACVNGIGRLCAVSDRTGSTTYAFDLWGRVTAKTQVTGALSRAMGYAYNAAGQLAIVTTPSGRQVSYGYANNRPVSVTVDGVPVLGSAEYEPFGAVAGWLWGNHSPAAPNAHARIVDRDFRVSRVRSDLPATASQAAFDRQLGWDDQGRVMSIADLANAALSAAYGYDSLDRLASASQGASSWGFTYNGIGDRLTSIAGGATTTYGYAAGTHRLQSLSGAQTRSYSFDAAGNMTSDGNLTWVYGGHNRPTAIGPLAIHVNALGQRVKKQGPTSATVFAYDEAGRLWGEYTDGGALLQETVWLDDLPVATLRPGATGADVYYVHTDHLGTPRAVTRPVDNQFVWRWDNTEPFGNALADENPGGLGVFAFNLRFPGQYFDSETGTHYNYFRDYDSAIGRYVQSDPIGLDGGLNTYGYVGGNPLRWSDPEGLQVPPINGLIGGGAGAGGVGTGAAAGGAVGWGGSGTGYGSSSGWGQWGSWGGSDGWGKPEPSQCPDPDPCRGLREQLKKHEKKLKDYSDNPPSHDNLGLLGQGYDHFIIPGRKRSLQKQIDNFRRQLEECEAKHGKGR